MEEILKMDDQFAGDMDTDRDRPVCFDDKVVVYIRRNTEQREERDGTLVKNGECEEITSLHEVVLGEDLDLNDETAAMFQVLVAQQFKSEDEFTELSNDPLTNYSLLEGDPELQQILNFNMEMEFPELEAALEEEGELDDSSERRPLYYEDKIQLQHLSTKKYVAFDENQSFSRDNKRVVCLKEENGADCIFKVSSQYEALSLMDEVCYGTHVVFESTNCDNALQLRGMFLEKGDTLPPSLQRHVTTTTAAPTETMATNPTSSDSETQGEEVNKEETHVETDVETKVESTAANEIVEVETQTSRANGHIPKTDTQPPSLPPEPSQVPPTTQISNGGAHGASKPSPPKVQKKASEYILQLKRHVDPKLKVKRPKKKLLKRLSPIPTLLSDLQDELSTDESWLSDFVGVVNQGHVTLIELIKDLITNPVSIQRKNRTRYAMLEREPGLLDIALLCLKTLTSHNVREFIQKEYKLTIIHEGLRAVLSYEAGLCGLYEVIHCLYSEGIPTKAIALQVMSRVIHSPFGYDKVIEGLDHFRAMTKQSTRFGVVVKPLLHSQNEPSYQSAALHFINTLVQRTEGYNKKVFFQQEMLEAGFNVQEVEKLLGNDEGVRELQEWREKYVDVQQCMSKQESMRRKAEETSAEVKKLKEELSISDSNQQTLQDQMKELTLKHDALKIANHSLQEKLEQTLRSLKYSLTSNRNKLLQLNNNGMLDRWEDLLLLPLVADVETQTTAICTMDWEGSDSPTLLAVPAVPLAPTPPPTPPPPPPPGAPPVPAPPPPMGFSSTLAAGKKPIIPKLPLPILNWDPIRNADGTIFKGLDYESVLEKVDFTEFETLFQTQRRERGFGGNGAKVAAAKQLNILEKNRTRNILIAKRRIGHSAEQIRDCILQTDTEKLPSEHCELLLKCIPSHQELTDLEKNADQADGFGEAEQFMYQLAKIEGYESKLRCMAYMGNFDELLNTTQPRIDSVRVAAQSVLESKRLHQLFETILAFGNYMNSSKKGIVFGFKLKSLNKMMDTKSLDRKQTLLQYIAYIVNLFYPEVLSFHEDLEIEEACKVSTSIIAEDMSTLKEGLERSRQEGEDESIISFCQEAAEKIQSLSDLYKEMMDTFEKTCVMFGESPKTTMNGKGMDYSEFFGMFASFTTQWKAAVQANRKAALRGSADYRQRSASPRGSKGSSMATVALEVAQHAAAKSYDFAYQTKKLDELQSLSRAKNTKKGSGVVMKRQGNINKHVEKFNKPQRSPFGRRKK